MKKCLFILFILSSFLPGLAEYSDFYKVFYNGKEIADNDTIVCSDKWETIVKNETVYCYQANVNVINQLDESSLNKCNIFYTDSPSYEQWEENKKKWGNISLCYHGGDFNGEMASCMANGGIVVIPDNSYNCFNWEIHLDNSPLDVKSIYKITLKAAQGSLQWSNYEYIDNTDFTFYVLFGPENESNGINSIEEEGITEYYTLSGVKISNPSSGIYIEKKGKKVRKIIRPF